MSIKIDRNTNEFIKCEGGLDSGYVFARLSLNNIHIALSKSDIEELEQAIKDFKEDKTNFCYCSNCKYSEYDEDLWQFYCNLNNNEKVDIYDSCEKYEDKYQEE